MNILITGVAGFIGSNLAAHLISEGHKVYGVDDLSQGLESQIPSGVTFYKLDIRSDKFTRCIENIDAVYHLAAKNCISDCQKDAVSTIDINVCGTTKVFQACVEKKISRVIYAESSAVYEGVHQFPTGENDVNPISFYGVSKNILTQIACAYSRFFPFDFTALRYFNVYGPHQDYRRSIPPIIPAFYFKLVKGNSPIIYGDGSKKRDYIFIDDVNSFHSLLLKCPASHGKVYNVGTGLNYSVIELYNKISNILKINIDPTYENDLQGEAQTTQADMTNAKLLGWKPQVDLDNGLRQTLEFLKTVVI